MKKQLRPILFLCVTLLLLTLTALAASAASPFSVGSSTYATLEEAAAAVPSGGTITVTENVSVTSATLSVAKAYTIKGSTNSVKITLSNRFTVAAGTVTLQSIAIESSADYAIYVNGSSTTLNVKSGTTVRALTSSTTAITSGNKAKLNVDGGMIYGMIGVAPQPSSGPIITINGGTFYPNEAGVSEGKATHLVTASRAGTKLTVNGGTFDLTGVSSSGASAIVCNSESATVTITNGTFKGGTLEGQKLFGFYLGTFAVSGGTFSSSAPNGCIFYLESQMKPGKVLAPSLTVSGGLFNAKDTCRVMLVTGNYLENGQFVVTISNGTFLGSTVVEGVAMFEADAGQFEISGGSFTTKGSVLFDLALRKSIDDCFNVTGGTFTLESSTVMDCALIRTSVAVSLDELDKDNSKDPTSMYYASDVDISLSGGIFIDKRNSTSTMIDASIGSSKVIVGDAVLLSTYAKKMIVDGNDLLGADVAFAGNTVTVKYNNAQYYCYRKYEAITKNTYSPVMEAGAYVALTSAYNGIRFSSYIPASIVTKLTGRRYTMGTLIAPADYVASAGGFTHEKLTAWGASANVEIPYVDIVAKNSIENRTDGSISFSGALVDLNSYTRAYAAVSYVKYGSTYYYSTYRVEDNVRTMAYVSKMAYTATVEDGYESLYMPGAYSEYTEEEQQLLQTFSGYTAVRHTASVTPSTNIMFGDNAGANLQSKATALISTLTTYGYGSAGTPIFVGSKGTLATKALAKVEGYGYYIGVIDGTIVIAGSNDALTMQAVDVFSKLCRGGKISLTEIICSNADMVPLNAETPFVYSHTRDARAHNVFLYGTSHYTALGKNYAEISFNANLTHLYNKDTHNNSLGIDYPLLAALEIAGALLNADYEAGLAFTYVPDDLAVSGAAIYIGNTALTRINLLAGKDVGYYGYSVQDGKVFVGSYDDATLRLAKAMFIENLGDFALDTNGDGTADLYAIPADFRFEKGSSNGFTGDMSTLESQVGSDNYLSNELKNLVTNYPRPQNLSLSGAVSVSNGELELYYLNAKLSHYQNYCALLEENGYVAYMTEREIDGSFFVTYVNNQTGIMLHIIYNGYRWASVQNIDVSTDNTLDGMLTPTLRVISAKTTVDYGYVHHVLPENLLTKQSYKKLTDSKLTVVQLNPRSSSSDTSDSSFGYCYVYTLEDGRFVVLDGGNGHSDDITNVYNVLATLHKEIHGSAPSASNPIRIAAWYISHGHGDHVGLLNKFTAKYCNQTSYSFSSWSNEASSKVVVESIIANFPSNDEIYNAHSVNQGTLNKMGTSNWYKNSYINASGKSVTDEYVPFYNVHTGQNFYVGNLEFEVIFTTEDVHPWSMIAFNNGCTVIRLTAHAHNVADGNTVAAGAVASAKVSNMVLGDTYVRPARIMRATFGPYLASDIVVSGHHASGGEGELYELINAKIVLWTCRAESMRSGTTDDGKVTHTENMHLVNNTRWLYMFSGRALKAYTDTDGYIYNPTMTITASGIAGLTDSGDVWENAQTFMSNLRNVAGSGTLAYGDGFFTGGNYDGSGAVLWRGNYFTDTTLPDHIDWGELPELPLEPVIPNKVDGAFDTFGEEIQTEIKRKS
ncbi:MAG: MBL fold metallo-hydrolase [Clostridia bacterium]|nr:MBL fold metallo-hydrolase [Clostridia bacterium]MBR7112810.1 MBL fold metallo-hydrolase [Clostridia bacterium]